MPIETIVSNPVYLAGAVAGLAGLAGAGMYKQFVKSDEAETIQTEGMTSRLEKIFVDPTKTQGSSVKDYIKQRGVSNTPQLVGFALRAKEHSVNVLKWDSEENEFDSEEVEGVTYTIIEGSSKLGISLKRLRNTVLPKDYTVTYDAPEKIVVPGDDFIWFTPEAHFIKYNGVKRQLSAEGMGRAWDSSFAGLHENFLETLQDVPEQYATLNNRISGQLKMENIKSENIRQYKKDEERNEKDLN